MSTYQLKIGSISLDTEKDKYIIEFIEKLKNSHKTQEFIKQLLSVAIESPELMNNQVEFEKVIKQFERFSGNLPKDQFIKSAEKEISNMQNKIDSIYEKVMEMYILSQFGKKNGLEDKSKNKLGAQFILQQQVNSLNKILGTDINTEFISSKVKDQTEWADGVLSYILDSYDGLIRETINNVKIASLAIEKTETPVVAKRATLTPKEESTGFKMRTLKSEEDDLIELDLKPGEVNTDNLANVANFFGL